jgi:2-hydroxymuconate-semialdehyde hydrolase
MTGYQSKEFIFEGVPVHYIEAGAGFPILLIHGSGPGASTIGNWRLILEPLAEKYHVFAMDLIGFGLSGRRPAPPFFDIDFWQRQCRAMLDLMPGETVGILGHSLSGALALKLTAAERRVTRTMTTGSMGAAFAVNADTSLCWTFPADRAALRATAEMLIHDHSHITEAYIDNRVQTLFEDAAYGAYFSAMFAGDHARFAAAATLSTAELARIKTPVTMLHGREDTAFPPAITLALAQSLPQADVTLLAHCSHSIALEFPQKLLAAASLLFG